MLPTYAFWKFDDFSWGDTRKTDGEKVKKAGYEYEGEFDSSKITMKRWGDFEQGTFSLFRGFIGWTDRGAGDSILMHCCDAEAEAGVLVMRTAG